jgi:TolB protein
MRPKLAMATAVAFGLVAAALAMVAALPAGAKVPGSNGLIAFVRSDNNTDTTYIVNADGTDPKALMVGSNPHWSPDGSLLAIATPFKTCCAAATTILNVDTGKTRVLKPPDPSAASTFTVWSPDGTHFAGGLENDQDPSVNGLYTIRTSDGRGLTQLTHPGPMIDIPIDYSPDGTRIVFGRQDPSVSGCTKASALYVVNVDGSGLHQITPGGFCDDDGSWSPDGSEIIFEHHGSLFVVHPDGTGLAQLPLATSSFNHEGDATWSPDGTKIAFILFTCTSVCNQEGIGTANADGSNVQQITATPGGDFDHEADWGSHPLIG